MDFASADVESLLSDFDVRRQSLHLSYQNLADSCGVSQATVIRIFRRQAEPNIPMLQKLAAAVKYMPREEPLVPESYSQSGYIQFLQESIAREKTAHEMRLRQQEAHYNLLLQHERRTVKTVSLILLLLVLAFICWLIIDVTHPEIGWIQSPRT